jgi:hypothetical protein
MVRHLTLLQQIKQQLPWGVFSRSGQPEEG